MKITIDLDGEWVEEQYLSEAIQKSISDKIIQNISQSIKDRADKAILKLVNKAIESQIDVIVANCIAKVAEQEVVTRRGVESTVVDHLKSIL